ncbi:hypothetical protein BCR33DRAFT_805124 [Rhizoclosmatium globosum]|uniref:ABC transmembrane type-1 domain-containing protein n=1 Tax=Rhizoclosmatium globosum TaxID=329046 RepID=A0A1Y2CM74_9FUNG|nr:hypothetical protein BCR33DRAFT_805124 [Rhizoclosmatium globosum]|eukprot:ORY48057.1 hypothetical protein BCR33DRAFT_805124 [Rhizoclosmatium globosum]
MPDHSIYLTRFRLLSGLLYILNIACLVGTPLVLQQVIDLAAFNATLIEQKVPGLSAPTPVESNTIQEFPLITNSSWTIAFLLLSVKVSGTFFGCAKEFIVKRLAFNIRTVLVKTVAEKTLTISASKAKEFSYVLNVVNVDAESIAIFAEQAHELWALPFRLFYHIVMNMMLGSSIGAGIAALLVSGLIECHRPSFILFAAQVL